MNRELWNTVIVALAALLLTLMVLMFVERNPWMLIGVAAILWAIAAIVRAIRGTPDSDDATQPRLRNGTAKRRASPRPRSRRTRRARRARER